MAAEVGIRVEGADELRRALRQAGNGLSAALAAANKNAASIVVRSALPYVPVRTGRLKRSVRALGSQRSGRAVAGRRAVPYAAAIHWGRRRGNVGSPPGNRKGRNPIAANPFLWEAAQRELPRIEPEYRDEVQRIIDAAIGRGISR
jgi:hypothetical protein